MASSSSATASLTVTSTAATPTASTPTHPRHGNDVITFLIGLSIILMASILNAAGLNLTKLDHVRTSAIPKANRRKDWLRPLWLLGMLLYILSQLIGSTLALEYMRAEYVAPLGSSSLVFNFLFARFLVGTPVTSTDIYGTIIVIFGVIGIVAFGSINSGLATETDVAHLTYLWRRGGWLGYFFFMTTALALVVLCTYKLDAILISRSDVSAVPFAGSGAGGGRTPVVGSGGDKQPNGFVRFFLSIKAGWDKVMEWLVHFLDSWTAAKDDKTVAWILGIGWACCGGGLAGGCLVFAKATVKLLSGSLSHENPGNQFGHASPVFTIIFLVVTAVMQIICLNRGLKVYDSTLVVPVFYGVYTATGFLDSLVFNDEVDAYQSWTLFLIFISMFVLISGVVLLTHKKPEPGALPKSAALQSATIAQRRRTARKANKNKGKATEGDLEEARTPMTGNGEQEVLWAVGDASDDDDDDDDEGEDEDIDHHQHPLKQKPGQSPNSSRLRVSSLRSDEGRGLISRDDSDGEDEDGLQMVERPSRTEASGSGWSTRQS